MASDFLNSSFFCGINYWESQHATQMWEHFDPMIIESDFRRLRDAGITHLRVFPLWHVFQPLKGYSSYAGIYEYGFASGRLPDTAAGQAGVSEDACRNFETFCDLAKKYGFSLIVGLITGHMSFRIFLPDAFIGKNLICDPTVLKWQLRFVKYFVSRFCKQDCIVAWDLGNECDGMRNGATDDQFWVWVNAISSQIRLCDPSRPVISGYSGCEIAHGEGNLKLTGELCDVHTSHPYNIFYTSEDPLPSQKPILDNVFSCRLSEDVAKIPTFIQEFGAIGYHNCSYRTEADFYRASLLSALAHGCHGTMWWCAFDQGHLDFAPYHWNNIGSDYGFFDKDGHEKPIVTENRRFADFLKTLPNGNLPPHQKDGVILIPRDDGDANIATLRATYLLGKRANLDLGFAYALDPIPDAPLYVFPSLRQHKSIPLYRLQELLAKVEAGATLYLSTDTALFRLFPQLTGVTVAYRECISEEKTLHLEGKALPLRTNVTYTIESVDAEILGSDANGTPLFFRHAYGKGWIYYLAAPLESYLAKRPRAFSSENEPPYDLILRTVAQSVPSLRFADSDSPMVRLTEHPIKENERYLFAINYAPTKKTVTLTLAPGVSLTRLDGTPVEPTMEIGANDGILLLAKKEG